MILLAGMLPVGHRSEWSWVPQSWPSAGWAVPCVYRRTGSAVLWEFLAVDETHSCSGPVERAGIGIISELLVSQSGQLDWVGCEDIALTQYSYQHFHTYRLRQEILWKLVKGSQAGARLDPSTRQSFVNTQVRPNVICWCRCRWELCCHALRSDGAGLVSIA